MFNAWSVQGKAFTVFPPDNLDLRTYRTNASFENQLKSNQDMPYRKYNIVSLFCQIIKQCTCVKTHNVKNVARYNSYT